MPTKSCTLIPYHLQDHKVECWWKSFFYVPMEDAGHNNDSKLGKQECTKHAKRARLKMREIAPNIWSHKIPKFLKPSDAWDFLRFILVVDKWVLAWYSLLFAWNSTNTILTPKIPWNQNLVICWLDSMWEVKYAFFHFFHFFLLNKWTTYFISFLAIPSKERRTPGPKDPAWMKCPFVQGPHHSVHRTLEVN